MRKIKRVLASFVALVSILGTNVIAANAEWRQSGNSWYYSENGGLITGWKEIDGVWYYFDSNGLMQTGWIHPNGTWYYLNSDGSMAHDAWIGNYYVNSSGEWSSSASSNSSNAVTSDDKNSQTAYLSETGTKYHSIPNCGKMNPNKATKTTVAKAEASNYQRCTKCW